MSVRFRVYGIPAPQGSKKPRVSSKGKPYVQEQSAKTLKPWRSAVREAAIAAREQHGPDGHDMMLGPVMLEAQIFLPRPASVTPKKRPWPTVAPDLDKIVRGIGDALKEAGVYKNDSQIVSITASKWYASEQMEYSPGALIKVTEIVTLPETQTL